MSDERTPLRVGVVGASFGERVHVPALRATGDFEIVAIASPTRAEEVAARRRIPRAFASLEAMLAEVELDVVTIASPPYEHRTQVLAALARGLHVLCEKPFGVSVAECEEMCAAAAAAGTVTALAHEFRYLPSRLAIAELIANGHLGAIREIEFSWADTFLRADGTRPDSWWFDRSRGGGITGAILSHVVDTATWLAGRTPETSVGLERTAFPKREVAGVRFTSDVADGTAVTIRYPGGLLARCSVDGTRAESSALLAVHGDRATALASGPTIVDSATYVVDPEESSELELRPSAHAKLAVVAPMLPAFVDLVADFARAVRGEATPTLPTFADGLATQRVLASAGYEVG